MNPDYERKLEAQIDAELKRLGELEAPASLPQRVMRIIEQRASTPWYRLSWENWPFALRTASLVGLCVVFASLCLGVWALIHGGPGEETVGLFGGWFAVVSGIWKTLAILVNTLGVLISDLGTGVVAAGIALVFMAWVACIGLGTVYVKLAMRPAWNRIEQ